MATIYSTGPNDNSSAAADDGTITSGPGHTATSWGNARAGTGLVVDDAISGDAHAYTGASSGAAGRGLRYECVRSFYHFDTSSTTACTAVTLDLMGFQGGAYNSGTLIVLKSDAFGHSDENALSTGDWDGIPGWSGSGTDDMTGATEYSTVNSSWASAGSYNTITLNSTAISDINSQDHFIIALVDYTYDYQATTPLASSGGGLVASNALDVSLGGYHNDFSTLARRPRLSLTIAAPSGYGNIVNTVVAASIGKVNTVATASIEKINTVD